MREEEEANDFFLRMETNLHHHRVPDRYWKNAVMKSLTRAATSMISEVVAVEDYSYQDLKTAIMCKAGLNRAKATELTLVQEPKEDLNASKAVHQVFK